MAKRSKAAQILKERHYAMQPILLPPLRTDQECERINRDATDFSVGDRFLKTESRTPQY